jgi:subtilase-type serine protease
VDLTLQRNDIAVADFGRTPNERATAAGIDSQGLGHLLYDEIVVAQATDNLGAVFAGQVDDVHASLKGVLIEDTRYVRNAATHRLRAAFDGVAATPQPTVTRQGLVPASAL